MTAPYDETEFIDHDLEGGKAAETAASGALRGAATPPLGGAAPAPTREELESQLGSTQDRLNELRRLQEQLEAERANIEETRRRRAEFEKGREEVLAHLTRGIGLLEKAEFESRRRAEQLARTLEDFRARLEEVQAINEERWSAENFSVELTAALTAVENARVEWQSARMKWPLLDGENAETDEEPRPAAAARPLTELGFWELCRLGLAVSLPVAVVALIGVGLLAAVLLRQ
jgi:vacuolar-type H+-ATPase subunit I/STV1